MVIILNTGIVHPNCYLLHCKSNGDVWVVATELCVMALKLSVTCWTGY